MLGVDNLWGVVAEGGRKMFQKQMVIKNDAQDPYEHDKDVLGENMW